MSARSTSTHHFEWLTPFIYIIVICLAITSLSRLGILVWQHNRVDPTGGTAFILLQGLRFDLVALGLMLFVPITLTPLVSRLSSLHRVWFRIIRVYLLAVVGSFLFMEIATVPFIIEYDTRPNFLFIEYLEYPNEVFSMLFAGYKIELAIAAFLVPAILWPVDRQLKQRTRHIRQSNAWSALPLAFISLIVCFAAVRSTTDHRAVNPSTVAYSPDTLVNSLALNSLYSVLYAVYELRHEEGGFAYGNVEAAESIQTVRAAMGLPASTFVDDAIPTLHFQEATFSFERPKNLVIIVEESLGAEFVGSLGGLPLTPYLDRYSKEGVWFEALYATGTRSARGLEAIVSGFPPTISQSVLKLGRAQQGFFTLGDYLGRKGYDTSFIYGGEAQFDNMKRFFANNGFDTVIDKHDFFQATFYGSWGASDEDVFALAHQRFSNDRSSQPFFSVLFTTSNHSPWQFPEDRIELYEMPKATVNNTVKYADYALGQFLQAAKSSSYWHDTVFLIVSDHNSRVYGAEVVPIERFHIPGLILGGGIAPKRVDRVTSQIDLLPTVLSLIGVSGLHPAPGIDLTRPDIDQVPARAIMQYGDTQAYREDNSVVVLRKEKPAEQFAYVDGVLSPMPADSALIKKAMALSVWPVRAYREQSYRLPMEEPQCSDCLAQGR